jgi:hypothetical protein
VASIAHLRGNIVGAGILTLFGSAWCIIALVTWPARPAWSLPVACLTSLALLSACVWRLSALRNIPSIDDPIAAAKGKRAGILFGIIFGAEGLLIGLCSAVLGHLHRTEWIPLAIAVIVGLHFLPLAHVFEVPTYYWTGALIVLAMLPCALIRNPDSRILCASLSMAAILWLTALWRLQHSRFAQPA